jgi:DNA-binding GntR family transcriptional regulator
MRVNEEFHTLIADASGNRPLAALWSALAAIADGHEAGVRYTPAAFRAMIAAHRKIGDAIIAGDADEAIRSMTLHLQATRDYVARYYPSIIDTPVMLVSGVP